MVLFLAVADVVGEGGEVRHFDAQSALDGASDAELKLIKDIKLRTNSNWDKLTDVPPDDYSNLKNEISLDLNLIIENDFKIGETSKKSSSEPYTLVFVNTPITSNNDLYTDSRIFGSVVGERAEFDESTNFAPLSEFSYELVVDPGFEVGSDVLALRDDISSKLDQITSYQPQ